jgi:hypothetical protein
VKPLAPTLTSVPATAHAAAIVPELRTSVGALLKDLAERTEPALQHALARAESAWDQADAVSIVDDKLLARAASLKARWQEVAASGEPGCEAAALEAMLAVDASLGLVSLMERRLATLIRLQLGGGGTLLPDGRPFLDVSSALSELARGWA